MKTPLHKIDIDDFIIIISFVKTITEFEGKEFPYTNLYDQVETYKLNKTPLDTQIHHIDDFMVDAVKVYLRMKATQKDFEELVENLPDLPLNKLFDKSKILEHVKKYQTICEDLMINYEYSDPEIISIQIGFLTEKMNGFVSNEEYEKAAEIRDHIKNLKS
ncbi:UvrB/UvrC motif-containing protein [Candidatus Dojkabacteria bacterium]|jgi:excinuclease UvrABC helicase subunit UvrB|nr:UvrB/UvrC motif-containing protein [Candidatus Dojkabacteria bacterium]